MIDILEELLRKIRPYELTKGSADAAFEQAMDAVIDGLSSHGVNGAKHGFAKAIGIMKQVPYDRSHPRPTVLIVGEYLLNFHPGANHDIEAFLEQNGFEIIEARMSDVIQKSYFYRDMQVREYHLHKPLQEKPGTGWPISSLILPTIRRTRLRVLTRSTTAQPCAFRSS